MSDAPARFSFPKDARLRTPADFARVQQGGRPVDLGPFVVRVRERAEGPTACGRLGLAVSRRVGPAVARNHVKRRVREWFRHHRNALAGLDLVVVARPAAATLETPAVQAHFARLLERLGRAEPVQ